MQAVSFTLDLVTGVCDRFNWKSMLEPCELFPAYGRAHQSIMGSLNKLSISYNQIVNMTSAGPVVSSDRTKRRLDWVLQLNSECGKLIINLPFKRIQAGILLHSLLHS